jgi:hypothetical protein
MLIHVLDEGAVALRVIGRPVGGVIETHVVHGVELNLLGRHHTVGFVRHPNKEGLRIKASEHRVQSIELMEAAINAIEIIGAVERHGKSKVTMKQTGRRIVD